MLNLKWKLLLSDKGRRGAGKVPARRLTTFSISPTLPFAINHDYKGKFETRKIRGGLRLPFSPNGGRVSLWFGKVAEFPETDFGKSWLFREKDFQNFTFFFSQCATFRLPRTSLCFLSFVHGVKKISFFRFFFWDFWTKFFTCF